MDYNAEGQRHVSRFLLLKDAFVPLRGLDGRWTGHFLSRDQLRYTDAEKERVVRHGYTSIDGYARFDYHELLTVTPESGVKSRMIFHRGGSGYTDPPNVKYGGILLSDVTTGAYPLGSPEPSGDGRGSWAPDAPGLFVTRVKRCPGRYKQDPAAVGSLWDTYGNPGTEWGGDVSYTDLNWSWLNVGGGGMMRGLLHDGHHIRKCAVSPIHMPMYDDFGRVMGEVSGQYVRTSNDVFGWMMWAHRFTGERDWTFHVERVA